jgi:hypothetical protein
MVELPADASPAVVSGVLLRLLVRARVRAAGRALTLLARSQTEYPETVFTSALVEPAQNCGSARDMNGLVRQLPEVWHGASAAGCVSRRDWVTQKNYDVLLRLARLLVLVERNPVLTRCLGPAR